MKGIAIGLAVTTLIKSVYKLLNIILTLVARIMILFGLWVPFFYVVITVITMLIVDYDFTQMGMYTILFYAGLGLSFLISVLITVRTMLISPIKELLNYTKVKKEYDKRKLESKKRELYRKNPKKYFAIYGDLPDANSEFYSKNRQGRDAMARLEDAPKIYRSQRNPNVIIHEYKDKFEVFYDKGDRIVYIDTKNK